MKLLVLTPIVTLMALYVAVTYGILYLLFTTFSFVFAMYYGFDEGASGTTFLPAGIGMFIGVAVFGAMSDRIVTKRKEAGIEHRPETRILPALTIPTGLALPVGLFIYGWTVEHKIHWIVPMIGVVIFSCGLMGVMVSIVFSFFYSLPEVDLKLTKLFFLSSPDVCPKLPTRRVPTIRRLRHCRASRSPLSRRCASPARRSRHV